MPDQLPLKNKKRGTIFPIFFASFVMIIRNYKHQPAEEAILPVRASESANINLPYSQPLKGDTLPLSLKGKGRDRVQR